MRAAGGGPLGSHSHTLTLCYLGSWGLAGLPIHSGPSLTAQPHRSCASYSPWVDPARSVACPQLTLSCFRLFQFLSSLFSSRLSPCPKPKSKPLLFRTSPLSDHSPAFLAYKVSLCKKGQWLWISGNTGVENQIKQEG